MSPLIPRPVAQPHEVWWLQAITGDQRSRRYRYAPSLALLGEQAQP